MANSPTIFVHLKLVASISLGVGLLAGVVLLAVLTVITGDTGQTYGDIIRLHSLTRKHLGAALLVAGLLLIAITGAITWLIVFYSSFRIAGPLYRFAQNLRLATASDSMQLIALRRGDALARHAAAIEDAVATLRHHYADLGAATLQVSAAAAAGDPERYAQAVARLKELDANIRL